MSVSAVAADEARLSRPRRSRAPSRFASAGELTSGLFGRGAGLAGLTFSRRLADLGGFI